MPSYLAEIAVHKYDNYMLVEEREYEDDNVKIFHMVYQDDRYVSIMPYSPYSTPSSSIFKLWIECGMPSSDKMGGKSDKHISDYYYRWLDKQVDRLLVEGMTDAL